MQEHHLAVTRTARYYTLGSAGPGTREVWFVCHGYGQLAHRFVQHFAPLDDGRRLIVAPEGLSRFYLGEAVGPATARKVGATWMTREDRVQEIADYIRYLDALHAEVFRGLDRAAVSVHLFGFSQGTATVCRWGATGVVRPDRIILWGGEVPPDLDLALAADRLRRARLVFVVGNQDDYITPKIVAREEERLRAHGIPYEVRRFDGGHELVPALLAELAR